MRIDMELVAWDCVKAVIDNVLGIHRSENWHILIEDMLTAFHCLNVRMSLKIHFLHSHVEKFAVQSPNESDEHGERFYQVTARFEHIAAKRYMLFWVIFVGIYKKMTIQKNQGN